MPKRKRENDGIPGDGETSSAKARRTQHKLVQGIIKLGHAFKVAKGFERQKLGRRRKRSVEQKGEEDVQRIDAEIASLKALDNATCARSLLYKSLLSSKAVAESDHLPANAKQPLKISTDPAALNVHARLCKSNAVKDALSRVLADVHQSLGIEVSPEAAPKKKRIRGPPTNSQTIDTDVLREASGESHHDKAPLPVEELRDQTKDVERLSEGLQDESDNVEDQPRDFRHMFKDDQDRAASARGGDQMDSNSNVDRAELQLDAERTSIDSRETGDLPYDHSADLRLSNEDAASVSASPEPQKAPAPKKSAFLPSLTMGGYISGSGSDIDDDIDAAPKKNRRGQKARQQIWEKKFGAKAQHLQKAGRNAGWDPRRGAIEGSESRGKGRLGRHPTSGNYRPFNVHSIGKVEAQDQQKKRDDDGPIHPSWEAAKKAKEKHSAGPVVFEGKKITFD